MLRRRGSALLMFAASGVVMMGFAALAIDVGLNTYTRTEIQGVADAAALAGGKALPLGTDAARTLAKDFGQRNGYNLQDADIAFPDSGTIQVQWTQPLQSAFSNLYGIHQFQVPVTATAQLMQMTGAKALRPWGIPLQDFEGYQLGQAYTLKLSPASDGYQEPGNFYPLALDGGGASIYRDSIKTGSTTGYEIGDYATTETGNVNGPTDQGLDFLVGDDPYLSYNDALSAGQLDSRRIVTIAVVDPDSMQNGKSQILIADFASFYITGWDTKGGITGQFIQNVHTAGSGNGIPVTGNLPTNGTVTLRLID